MGVPLTTLTQTPIQYDVSRFGGDDTQLRQSGLFGTIVQWDAYARDDVFKANLVFIMKKAFAFLDMVGIGSCVYGKDGFTGKVREYENQFNNHPWYCRNLLNRNRVEREKIIHAFGGEEACRAIPVISLNPADLKDYLKLGEQYFPPGQSIVQGEDPAGRKFVSMRLCPPTNLNNLFIATAHQRYRETDSDGGKWVLNFTPLCDGCPDTNSVVAFIKDVLNVRGRFIIRGY